MFWPVVFSLTFSLLSLLSLYLFKIKSLQNNLKYLLALSAGALLADAIFHLLPHAIHDIGFGINAGLVFAGSILISFTFESWLRWRECCETDNRHSPKTFGVMNLFGDSWCNFADGISLAAAFMASPAIGFVTALAIFLHELPQEIADFATLLHAGYSQKKALIGNVLVSLFSLLGVIIGWFALSQIDWLESYLLIFAAGSLTYLALSNLIPEVHRFHQKGFNWPSYFLFILGMALLIGIAFLENSEFSFFGIDLHEEHLHHSH